MRQVRFWIDRLMQGKREERRSGVKDGRQNDWLGGADAPYCGALASSRRARAIVCGRAAACCM